MLEDLCAHRRALLAGIGGLSAAALLAACGDSDATAKEPAAASPAAQSSGPKETEVAETSEVPVGGGIVAAGALVVQPESGTFKVFDAACPHKGILVTAPQNGVAVCPAHASKFNITDGSKITGPTPTGLKEIRSKVEGTKIIRLE